MSWFAVSGVTVMFDFVNDDRPLATVTSPGCNARFTTGLPFVPAAPGWMCARFTVEPAGNPPSVTAKFAVADVTLPALSRVVFMVTVTVPLTADSALVTGGTSFDGDRLAVKIGLVDGVGVFGVDESSPQPATNKLSAMAMIDSGFI